MEPYSVTVHHGPFLLLVATGDGQVCDAIGTIDLAAAVVEMQGYQRVLFDSLAVTYHLTDDDARRLGEHIAAKLAGVERVASVVRARSTDRYGESAAVSAGLPIRTFTDLREAFDWMSG